MYSAHYYSGNWVFSTTQFKHLHSYLCIPVSFYIVSFLCCIFLRIATSSTVLLWETAVFFFFKGILNIKVCFWKQWGPSAWLCKGLPLVETVPCLVSLRSGSTLNGISPPVNQIAWDCLSRAGRVVSQLEIQSHIPVLGWILGTWKDYFLISVRTPFSESLIFPTRPTESFLLAWVPSCLLSEAETN